MKDNKLDKKIPHLASKSKEEFSSTIETHHTMVQAALQDAPQSEVENDKDPLCITYGPTSP